MNTQLNGHTNISNGVLASPLAMKHVNGIHEVEVYSVAFNANLDPSKLTVTQTDTPKPLPEPSSLVFGQTMTDHMLVMSFDPETGWTVPVIQPYQPLQLDPASSCFQYCPNVFEGMKAYLGPDGEPRLFRPDLNMRRMELSVDRVALPPIDGHALLKLIKKLVIVDKRWIPSQSGYSLYIRPTIIGTRPALGVAASSHALLYVIMSPTGPYFPTGPKPVSLLAVHENVRSWPGGTGGFKLGLNYAPAFEPQRRAAEKGYMQILWLLGHEGERRITEAGQMNFFAVVKREDGDLDLVTPPLDGTILPGVTRNSVLALAASHSPLTPLPNITPSQRINTHEKPITMSDLTMWYSSGLLLEVFCVGTAVTVASVGRIGYEGKDMILADESRMALGVVAGAISEKIIAIQEGRFQWEGWSVPCKE
ncbi:branched-chain amino acid aminotransferase II [Rickenella mellea]|uniref:Branched-chain-amino-acid aminotransferase n=1 Tax=Rickenella mellea TaxID=50990 RepID=A0A4Y7Q4T8_9AGAM|nr:branched-chain amino acid aminotransferase II [Rickenella mellea]